MDESPKPLKNAHIIYVSPTQSVHDSRFTTLFEDNGAQVTSVEFEEERSFLDEVQRISGESLINNGNSKTVLVTGPLGQLNLPFDSIEIPTIGISWAFDLMRDSVNSNERNQIMVRSLESLHAIVVDNDASVRILVSLGYLEENIFNFPWGVSNEFGSPADVTNALLHPGVSERKIVLSPRSLQDHYNQPLIVKAFSRILQKFRDSKLVLIDDNPIKRKELMDLARELKIEDSVIWYPFLQKSQLEFLLKESDVLVTAPSTDGTSVTVLEAMKLGIPVVSSTTLGSSSWIFDGVTGFTFGVGDEDGCVNALSRALEMKHYNVIENAKRLVEAKAKWPEVANPLISLIQSLTH
jgi:glycosyltransferase involved in cell wall biosynthesis